MGRTREYNICYALNKRMLFTLALEKVGKHLLVKSQNVVHVTEDLGDESIQPLGRYWRVVSKISDKHQLHGLQIAHVLPLGFNELEYHGLPQHLLLP